MSTPHHHTPGIWKAGKQIIEDETYVPYISIREGQKHIAMVTYGMPAEMFANARLIAAAPALRDALQRLADAAYSLIHAENVTPDLMDELKQAMGQAYAVLSDAPYTA